MESIRIKTSQRIPLPFLTDRVAAGFPSPATDHEEKDLDLNEHLIEHPSSTFFIRVEGDSMEGAAILDNDILIVDRSITPTHGSIVVAVVHGEITVKRLFRENKRIELHAENPQYAPIDVSYDAGFKIWGVVSGVVRKT